MQQISQWISHLTSLLWSGPLLLLLFGTHLYFTFHLNFIQRFLPRGIRLSISKKDASKNGVSPFGALSTALAATIGTGNIIGISTAIALGGPGAVFWCWLTGFFGVATCYGECFLSLRFRHRDPEGHLRGGPMYVLDHGLHQKGLATLFAVVAALASLGMGSSVQSHSICTAIRRISPLSPHLIGILTALLAGMVMLGGIKKIAQICTFFVPFMSLFYLAGCGYLLFFNRPFLWSALILILKNAFSLSAIGGGISGGGLILAMRIGISRGLFTNEAGLGSIPMAAATSKIQDPVRQSLISMTGPFWDTVVICAITGLVIVSSMLASPHDFSKVAPDELCFFAFSQLPWQGEAILSVSLILFAFATILGWCCYGECAVCYLGGQKGIKTYQVLYLLSVYLGATLSLNLVWDLSDLLNAIMMFPNLLGLWLLRHEITLPCKKT